MIRAYFKMKKNEWKLKGMFYGVINSFFEEKKDIIESFHKIYNVLKETPIEELKDEIVRTVSFMLFEQSMKDNTPE